MAGNIQCQLVIFHSFGAFVGININLILTQNLSDSLLCSCFYYFIIDLALGEIEILFLKEESFLCILPSPLSLRVDTSFVFQLIEKLIYFGKIYFI